MGSRYWARNRSSNIIIKAYHWCTFGIGIRERNFWVRYFGVLIIVNAKKPGQIFCGASWIIKLSFQKHKTKIGHFRSLHWRPCWLSCINEYLAIDSDGNVSDLVLERNCCLARMLPGEAELVSEWTGLSGKAKSVKRFERSNGLDTALYKNYLYL